MVKDIIVISIILSGKLKLVPNYTWEVSMQEKNNPQDQPNTFILLPRNFVKIGSRANYSKLIPITYQTTS